MTSSDEERNTALTREQMLAKRPANQDRVDAHKERLERIIEQFKDG